MLITRLISIDRIRGPTRSGRALSRIYKSFLSLLRKTCVASVTQRFLFPVSRSKLGTPGAMTPLLCHKHEEKWVSLLTQA